MNNENEPAFPFEYDGMNGKEIMSGLTKREYFAAHAGPVPDWFEHQQEVFEFTKPVYWYEIPNETDGLICRDWLDDVCDLPEHLQWFSDTLDKRDKEVIAYRKRDEISRYFQWKVFYADSLLLQLNKQ